MPHRPTSLSFVAVVTLAASLAAGPALAGPSAAQKREIRNLEAELLRVSEFVEPSTLWCAELEATRDVSVATRASDKLGRELHDLIKPGSALDERLWGPGGLVPSATGLSAELDRCERRTGAVAQCEEAASVGATDPSRGFLSARRLVAELLARFEGGEASDARSLTSRLDAAEGSVVTTEAQRRMKTASTEREWELLVAEFRVLGAQLDTEAGARAAADALERAEARLQEVQRFAAMANLFRPQGDIIQLRAASSHQASEAARAYDAASSGHAGLFAFELMPAWADRWEKAKESEFLRDELIAEDRRDPGVKAEQRVWIEYIAGLDFVAAIDRPKVSYDDGVYSLSIASFDPGPNGLSDWDKAQQTSLYGWATTGVAVGLWRRVRWENFLGYAQARVPLTGMPRDLMARLESELGRTIEVRWRWSGAGKPKTLESGPMMGFISTNTWLVPNRLRLEFVEAGEVVWTFE